MNRGDIWTVAGGAYAAKARPAVIIQDDRFSSTDSVTVLPLTSQALMHHSCGWPSNPVRRPASAIRAGSWSTS